MKASTKDSLNAKLTVSIDHRLTNIDYEYRKYLLPVIKDAKFQKRCLIEEKYLNPHISLEAFKNQHCPIKPGICIYTFMTEDEVKIVKEETDYEILSEIIENKLKKIPTNGPPKNLLIDLFISAIKFSNKHKYDIPQTGALLSMFYNTHLYLSYNLFATPEELYMVFKEYIYCHSISVAPYKTKLFEPKEADQLMMYFCSIYLRNLPLIRFLMFPNYGLKLRIRNPIPPDEAGKKGKKGKDKKKK